MVQLNVGNLILTSLDKCKKKRKREKKNLLTMNWFLDVNLSTGNFLFSWITIFMKLEYLKFYLFFFFTLNFLEKGNLIIFFFNFIYSNGQYFSYKFNKNLYLLNVFVSLLLFFLFRCIQLLSGEHTSYFLQLMGYLNWKKSPWSQYFTGLVSNKVISMTNFELTIKYCLL